MKILAILLLFATALTLTEGKCDYRNNRMLMRRLNNRARFQIKGVGRTSRLIGDKGAIGVKSRLIGDKGVSGVPEETIYASPPRPVDIDREPKLDVCMDRENGRYQHPYDCSKFVTCSEGDTLVSTCQSGLHYSHVQNQCVEPKESNCMIFVGQTTLRGKDGKFGKISLEMLPKGNITQIKLEYVSGLLPCRKSKVLSKWGCSSDPEWIGTVITDKENKVLVEQPEMPGCAVTDNFIVFESHANEAMDAENLTTNAFQGKEMRIWDLRDLKGSLVTEGRQIINVYVTVDSTEKTLKREVMHETLKREELHPTLDTREMKVIEEDPKLHGVCMIRTNGNYSHPYDCSKFVDCKDGYVRVRDCPAGLHYNHMKDKCLKPKYANCLVYVGETAFGAKNRMYGKVSLRNLPRGEITQIKLEHVDGYVTCMAGVEKSKWGCNRMQTKEIIGTVITNKMNKKLVSQRIIPGYTGNSPYIVFNDYSNESMDFDPVSTDMFPDHEMRIWYKQDLDRVTTRGNSGIEKIKVYVTVEA